MPATTPRPAKRFSGYLLLLIATLGFLCSCQSNRHLCPAYDQHYRRETLPY